MRAMRASRTLRANLRMMSLTRVCDAVWPSALDEAKPSTRADDVFFTRNICVFTKE